MFQEGLEVSTIRIKAWAEYRNSMLKEDVYMRERKKEAEIHLERQRHRDREKRLEILKQRQRREKGGKEKR